MSSKVLKVLTCLSIVVLVQTLHQIRLFLIKVRLLGTLGTDTLCHVGTHGFLVCVEFIIMKMFYYIVLY
jgi:hypothetical protein